MASSRLAWHVALALSVVALAACSVTTAVGPRSFTVSAETTDGAARTVRVDDTSGRITDVAVDPTPPFADLTGRPFNVPGSPDVLVVPWVGGGCDTRTTFTVAPGDDGLIEISYFIDGAPGDCDAIGISHQLVLGTSPAVPAVSVMIAVPAADGGE